MATATELVAQGQFMLQQGPHPDRARRDAESLLLHAVQVQDASRNKAWLIRESNAELPPHTRTSFLKLVARRVSGEPIQYILAETEFFGLRFSVEPGVLIPRPETEHLVEEVIRLARENHAERVRIADVGTGSGIIAVALAHTLPHAELSAVDLSADAVRIASKNALRNLVDDRIRFHVGDLLAPVAGRRFHIVASNPPYIPTGDHDALADEVRKYEPHSALFAGEDGLSVYRRLIPSAHESLVPGGFLVLEIGFGQRDAVEVLLAEFGYTEIRFIRDYQGIPRVAVAQSQEKIRVSL